MTQEMFPEMMVNPKQQILDPSKLNKFADDNS